MTLQAGTASASVTPPVGYPMGGYGARDHGCEGTHDELRTKALYLSDGQREVAVITADLLGLRAPQLEQVRRRVQELTSLDAAQVMVACSHTHGGPLMYSDFAALPEAHLAYLRVVYDKLAGTVAAARAAAVPARWGQGRTGVQVGINRREHRADGTTVIGVDPEGPVDPWVNVLLLERQDTGAPLALLFQHAVHGTCLGGDNYWITADIMGVAQRVIETCLPGVNALFVNGCAGNINPYPRGTLERCEKLGARLGAAAVKAAMEIEETEAEGTLACHLRGVELPLEEPAAPDELERLYRELEPEYAALRGETHRNWALSRRFADVRAQREAARGGEVATGLPTEVQAVALGDLALVSLPGEIFVEIGHRVTAGSPFGVTWPVGYANGSIGYVPTREEIPFGGYEVMQARARLQGRFIRGDAEDVLVAGALGALGEVGRG